MKVVVAPDKFAGTLSAADAAAAIASGWRSARPHDEVVAVPMADGGEGTLEVVAAAVDEATTITTEVADARGRATSARWLRLPDGRALVEAAQAVGLSRLRPAERDPLAATSYGVGQLLAAAVEAGAGEVVVTLGGSATVDGGAGLAIAVGHRLLRADGNGVKVGAEQLVELERIVAADPPAAPVRVAVDVANPLLGERGAAAVYAPQKGAGEEDVAVLESCLARLADIAERDLDGGPWRDLPGAGAAGGLGFGLAAFASGVLTPGGALVAELVGLDAALADADVVVTGEGRLDAQTAAGKTPAAVAERARAGGARVAVVAGQLADGAGADYDHAVDLGPDGLTRAAELCHQRGADLAAMLAGA